MTFSYGWGLVPFVNSLFSLALVLVRWVSSVFSPWFKVIIVHPVQTPDCVHRWTDHSSFSTSANPGHFHVSVEIDYQAAQIWKPSPNECWETASQRLSKQKRNHQLWNPYYDYFEGATGKEMTWTLSLMWVKFGGLLRKSPPHGLLAVLLTKLPPFSKPQLSSFTWRWVQAQNCTAFPWETYFDSHTEVSLPSALWVEDKAYLPLHTRINTVPWSWWSFYKQWEFREVPYPIDFLVTVLLDTLILQKSHWTEELTPRRQKEDPMAQSLRQWSKTAFQNHTPSPLHQTQNSPSNLVYTY